MFHFLFLNRISRESFVPTQPPELHQSQQKYIALISYKLPVTWWSALFRCNCPQVKSEWPVLHFQAPFLNNSYLQDVLELGRWANNNSYIIILSTMHCNHNVFWNSCTLLTICHDMLGALLSLLTILTNQLILITLRGNTMISPIYRWGNWGMKRLNDLSKVTQLVRISEKRN